ncbi:DUF6916 family protein [Marichromatium gracile]|uniref:DUF6916 domain-containing protein n=1 Tax=Marichromatium gracile TaxID=1048 RepID=A0ABR5VD44_MARGR|nr:hypothetical protein [Marichromatium gracile]KXX63534.1 hypothetical protein AY586_16450 [Marichromatium gracile]
MSEQAAPSSLYMLRADHFRDKVGHPFQLETLGGALPLTLVEVHEGEAPLFSGSERRPFRLTFLGPPGVLPTACHLMMNLRHATLGLIEGVFIGPNVGDVGRYHDRPAQLWSATFT